MSVEMARGVAVEERSGRPEGMPWITPYLMVQDVPAAIDFYEAAFGFERQSSNAGADGVVSHARMAWREGMIMVGLEGAYGGTSQAPATSGVECAASTYVYCDDVDALTQQAAAAGAKIKFGPTDTFWGDRCCNLVDPNGHIWTFATHNGKFASHH